MTFHEPMELPDDLDASPSENEPVGIQRQRVEKLTDEMQETLIQVVRATDGWEIHSLMHRGRTLIAAEHKKRFGTPLGDDSISNRNLLFIANLAWLPGSAR